MSYTAQLVGNQPRFSTDTGAILTVARQNQDVANGFNWVLHYVAGIIGRLQVQVGAVLNNHVRGNRGSSWLVFAR